MDGLTSVGQRNVNMVGKDLRAKLNQLYVDGRRVVPPERVLAMDLGVRKDVVRRALEVLEVDGWVRRYRSQRIIVSQGEIDARLAGSEGCRTSPLELISTRLVLEPIIASSAAMHALTEDLEAMYRCIDMADMAKGYRAWERWDGFFHRLIAHATRNGLLIRTADMLNEARTKTTWHSLCEASLTPELLQQYTRQHECILAAMVGRDVDQAAETVRQHLVAVKRAVIERID